MNLSLIPLTGDHSARGSFFLHILGVKRRGSVLGLAMSLFFCGCETEESEQGAATPLTLPDGALAPREDQGLGVTDGALSAPLINATIRLLNPATGRGFEGVSVTGDEGSAESDELGRATIPIRAGAYALRLEAPGARPHRLFGVSGEVDFEQISYLSPDMITGFVFNLLGIEDSPGEGILVVGLDLPSLAPAIGAEASLDRESGSPFVFAGSQPTMGSVIPEGGQGFVTFPGLAPGAVQVRATYPGGRCVLFPAGPEGEAAVEISAGEVSILAFSCARE